MNVNFEYYKIFFYVAKYHNFTKAAHVLGNSQPNVTRAMNCLEQQINTLLFVRTNRGVELTPEGEKLYIRVSAAMAQIFEAEELRSCVRLEIGPLAEWLPSHETSITPFAAEKYPDIFSQTDTSVLTIDVERTFWEKLTILHKIANFPEGKSLPARYARHLYDVYNMGNSWVKESAFKRKELLEKDVAFKQKFYYAKGAHYETATLSSIELLPKEAVLNALKEDYQAMSNMIYGNIPEFKDILVFLEKLQKEIHGLE